MQWLMIAIGVCLVSAALVLAVRLARRNRNFRVAMGRRAEPPAEGWRPDPDRVRRIQQELDAARDKRSTARRS